MSSVTGGPLVFTHRRYLLWKALDAWLLDSPASRGAAMAWASRAKALPQPAPWPSDWPARAQLEAHSLVPLVGPEDLIGASAEDLVRACPALRLADAQAIAERVRSEYGDE